MITVIGFLCVLDLLSRQFVLFFVVGLDAAGKTTILYKLKLGEIVTTIPTIGNIMLTEIICGKLSVLCIHIAESN